MSSVADARRAVSAPARRPLVSLRFFGLLLVIVAAFTGSGALTNNLSALRCERIARPGGGPCTFERGSLAFAYTEEFFVNDLVKAEVVAGDVDVPNRAADGGGERIYVVTTSDTMRFIDNDVWDHDTRVARAAEINAFISDPKQATLAVVFDERLSQLLTRFIAGVVVGLLALGVRAAWR